jgi:uncharacterized membrane protein YbhN (UPF0104 family)
MRLPTADLNTLSRPVAFRATSLDTVRTVLLRTGIVVATASLLMTAWLLWTFGVARVWSVNVVASAPAFLLLGIASYGLRLLRWHVLAKGLAPRLSARNSARVYIAGFALGLTPARAGEFLKFTLLRQFTGVSELQSAPIFLVERASEAIGCLVVIALGTLISGAAIVHVKASAYLLALWIPALAIAVPFVRTAWRRFGGQRRHGGQGVRHAFFGIATVAQPRALALVTLLAITARGADVLLYWFALGAFGAHVSIGVAGLAYGIAGLAGGLSLLPAGVGAVEATLVTTVMAFGGSLESALAAGLVARTCTTWVWIPPGLWFAMRAIEKSATVAGNPTVG